MIGLIIYLIGFILTYLLCKHLRTEHTWEDVWICFFWAIFSWFGFVFVLLVILYQYIKQKYNEPPKWL